MLQNKLIDAAQRQEAHPIFVAGPLLTDLLSDPIMHMLMAADRVEYRDIEAVLQRAQSQLGLSVHPYHRVIPDRVAASNTGHAIVCPFAASIGLDDPDGSARDSSEAARQAERCAAVA